MFLFGRKKKRAEAARRAEEARLAQMEMLAKEMEKAKEMKRAETARKEEEARKMKAAWEAQERAEAESQKAMLTSQTPEETTVQTQNTTPQATDAVTKKNTPKKKPKTKKPHPQQNSGKIEIKRANDGRYMFNVRAANTQIIASSQMYTSMTSCKGGIASIGANAPSAGIEDQTLQTYTEEKCPKFQIYLDKAGKYRFKLLASNGNNILSCTQGYSQKSSCKNGIRSVINNANSPTEIL